MNTIEKIRAEIERLNKVQKIYPVTAYASLLAFLDTLEAEEKEVDLGGPTIAEEIRRLGPNPSEFDVARHFYELGLNSRK